MPCMRGCVFTGFEGRRGGRLDLSGADVGTSAPLKSSPSVTMSSARGAAGSCEDRCGTEGAGGQREAKQNEHGESSGRLERRTGYDKPLACPHRCLAGLFQYAPMRSWSRSDNPVRNVPRSRSPLEMPQIYHCREAGKPQERFTLVASCHACTGHVLGRRTGNLRGSLPTPLVVPPTGRSVRHGCGRRVWSTCCAGECAGCFR